MMRLIISTILIFVFSQTFAQYDTIFTNFPNSNSVYIDENTPDNEPQEFLSNFIDFEK